MWGHVTHPLLHCVRVHPVWGRGDWLSPHRCRQSSSLHFSCPIPRLSPPPKLSDKRVWRLSKLSLSWQPVQDPLSLRPLLAKRELHNWGLHHALLFFISALWMLLVKTTPRLMSFHPDAPHVWECELVGTCKATQMSRGQHPVPRGIQEDPFSSTSLVCEQSGRPFWKSALVTAFRFSWVFFTSLSVVFANCAVSPVGGARLTFYMCSTDRSQCQNSTHWPDIKLLTTVPFIWQKRQTLSIAPPSPPQ